MSTESKFVSLNIPEYKRQIWDAALSDVMVWLDGFKGAGGKYSPESEHHLKDLRDAVRCAYQTTPPPEPPCQKP
jgi:hypothetical protein